LWTVEWRTRRFVALYRQDGTVTGVLDWNMAKQARIRRQEVVDASQDSWETEKIALQAGTAASSPEQNVTSTVNSARRTGWRRPPRRSGMPGTRQACHKEQLD
jgi:hypothetical protein